VRANRRKTAADAEDPDQPWLAEISRSFFPILVVVLLLRSFLVEPFQIPSGSMLPTLEVGDFILVNKFAYGLRLPVVHYEFLSVDDPERGDIMVFRYPVEPSINYIKRVVGTPGDRVRYEDKQLYINGERVETDFCCTACE
jgi:signal peptidase I, bacterial type